jgi:hypothetical protein
MDSIFAGFIERMPAMNKSRLFFILTVLLALASHFAESKQHVPPHFAVSPEQGEDRYNAVIDDPIDDTLQTLADSAHRVWHWMARKPAHHPQSADCPFADD